MSIRLLAASALILPFAVAAPAQSKDLEVLDLFRLDYLMVFPSEEPNGFVDADHYLVLDAGKTALQGPKSWSLVEAKTGKRERYVDRRALVQSLKALGADLAGHADDLDDADKWIWEKAHARFVLDVGGDLFTGGRDGKCVRLTKLPGDEVGAQFAPDGQQVAFVNNSNLYVVPAGGGDVRALSKDGNADLFYGRLDWVYQEELYGRGKWQGFWWSPDSQRIALLKLDEKPVQEFVIVSDAPARPKVEKVNYPKTGEANPIVEVGIVEVATGSEPTRWLDLAKYAPDDRLVVRVTWAPDGKEVFVQVQNREQTWLDMLAADAATGAVRTVFHEDSDCWVEAGPEPEFTSGGAEFLWLSERDGFRHLYRYARDGKLLGRMTEGEWQVKKVVAVDEAASTVWFTADKSSPLQTHLYRMPLAGGEIVQVTQGRGTHDVTMVPGNGAFVSQWSSAASPQRVTLFAADGAELRAIALPRTKMLDPFGLAEPEFVQIKTRDGFPMEAMLLKPRGFQAGTLYPVVQMTYSGPHTPRVRDEWGGRDYLFHQSLAQQGYLVFVCDNRSASGKGRRFAKACWRNLGASECQDLEDAVQWLVAHRPADQERIAIWGWSYGAYQTLYNLTHSEAWKCGIAVNAVTDWRNYDTIYTERYNGLPTSNAAGYLASSVVESAGKLHGKLLLVAAALDDNVHMQNSLQFLWAMQQAGRDCEFMVYPRVRHGIEDLNQQVHLFTKMRTFLQAQLGKS